MFKYTEFTDVRFWDRFYDDLRAPACDARQIAHLDPDTTTVCHVDYLDECRVKA